MNLMCDYSSLIYLFAGALIGFLSSYLLEKLKRNYELKKAVYFDALDVLTRGPQTYYIYKTLREICKNAESDMAKMKEPYKNTEFEDKSELIYCKNVSELRKELLAPNENTMSEWLANYKVIGFKLDICGSKKVKDISHKYFAAIKEQKPTKTINKEFIEAMREELIKPWWRFW